MGKGEIARNEQFLLFPQCFQKAYFPGASKGVIEWEWVKEFGDDNFKFDENGRKFYERVQITVGKEEITHYEQFLLFSTVFSKDLYCRHVKTRPCLGKG